ncbi:MAG TPA: hypothetical protein VM305_07570 [Candidatus Limnocylindrales bacterium]|nr:hypothetical protein [Candidatus Limnocylindrales bacterium]
MTLFDRLRLFLARLRDPRAKAPAEEALARRQAEVRARLRRLDDRVDTYRR